MLSLLLYCHYTGLYFCFAFLFLLFRVKLDNINRNAEEYPLQNSCDHRCQFNAEARQAVSKR